MYNLITLLYTWNQHNIVNQWYSNIKQNKIIKNGDVQLYIHMQKNEVRPHTIQRNSLKMDQRPKRKS